MSNVVVAPEFLNLESLRVAKAMSEHMITHADIVGEDLGGRPVTSFEFACDRWPMNKLAS